MQEKLAKEHAAKLKRLGIREVIADRFVGDKQHTWGLRINGDFTLYPSVLDMPRYWQQLLAGTESTTQDTD